MPEEYGYIMTLLESQQTQINGLEETQSELIAAIGRHQTEEIMIQQGIGDVVSVATLALGILIGGILTLIFSHGLRNAS
jgi:hypothetical protein